MRRLSIRAYVFLTLLAVAILALGTILPSVILWNSIDREFRKVRCGVFYSDDHGCYMVGNDVDPQRGWTDEELGKAVELIRKLNAVEWRWLMPHIRGLKIQEARVSDHGMRYVSMLPDLKTLYLFETDVSDDGLKWLRGLDACETIELSGERISGSGLVHLADLPRLRTLGLRGTRFSGPNLSHLAGKESLRSLDVGLCSLTDQDVACIDTLPALEKLWIDATSISDATVSRLVALRSLQELYLTQCRGVTDDSVDHLLQIPTLKILSVIDTAISRQGFERLRNGLPGCQIRWYDNEASSEDATDAQPE